MNNLAQASTKRHKNLVTIAGVIANDPIVRSTPTGKTVTSASICCAVTAKTKTFIRAVAWEDLADLLGGFRKGDFVEVNGRIQARSWEDASGEKRYITEVVISSIAGHDAVADVRVEASVDDLF